MGTEHEKQEASALSSWECNLGNVLKEYASPQ